MTTTNAYQEIAERNIVCRTRDVVFALTLAAVAAFSLVSISTAADAITATSSVSPAVVGLPATAVTCESARSC